VNAALAGVVSMAATVMATPVAIRVATRLGVVDRPGPAKPQVRPVPYLGGIAVMLGLTIPIAIARPAVLLPGALALALGLADDARDLPAGGRLAAEVGIGVVTAWLFPTTLSEPFGFVAVVIAVVALINAVNLIDGLDGLASSVVCLAAVGFAIVLDGPERTVAAALAGALAGFLMFNRPPARIYLGDAGSYLLGTLLAVLLAMAWASGEPAATGIGTLLLVVVPAVDLAVSVIRRLVSRAPLFTSDRGHIYDQLVDRAWAPTSATMAFGGAQALLVVAAVFASALEPIPAVLVVVACLVAVAATILSSGFVTFQPPGEGS